MHQVIDTRDLIERLDDIEDMLNEPEKYGYMFLELKKEKAEIETIRDSVEDYEFGATLIHEDYFTEYAEHLADELGVFSVAGEPYADLSNEWPFNCIDWEKAADYLADDYTTVEYLEQTYYVR